MKNLFSKRPKKGLHEQKNFWKVVHLKNLSQVYVTMWDQKGFPKKLFCYSITPLLKSEEVKNVPASVKQFLQ